VQQLDADAVEQVGLGLGLLFSSTASQGSGYCSSSCCGCCYCMGDECEGGCIGDTAYDVAVDEDTQCQAAESGDELGGVQHGAASAACIGNAEPHFESAAATAAAAAAAQAAFGGSRVLSGKLSMPVWNDAAALFDLEAEEGVGMRAAGFGGSAREA
jgi:hypothetical protein